MSHRRTGRVVAPVVALLSVVAGFVCFDASQASHVAHAAAPATQGSNPAPVSELARTASRCAAIVEGKVKKITFSYDEASGPRTNFHITVEIVHAGAVPGPELVLSQFGGFLPNGKFAGATHVPMLAETRRYLLFLQNGVDTGFWSGIVSDYAFAIEVVDGKEVLIGDDGLVLTEMSLLGPRFGRDVLFERVRFDGVTYPSPAKTKMSSGDVAGALDAASAALAITQAAGAEGVVVAGNLASPIPTWFPWNRGPFSPDTKSGGAQ